MTVEVAGEVRDYLDRPAAYGVAVPLEYASHYTSFLTTRDGIRGPVNTREELAEYDPDAYALMAAVYPGKSLPYPWRFTKDDFDVHGRPRVYNLGTTFDWEFIR